MLVELDASLEAVVLPFCCSDLEGLEVHPVRSAYSETGSVENAYFKLDIESRAIQKWGSWTALEEELRRKDEEEVERRRRSECWGHGEECRRGREGGAGQGIRGRPRSNVGWCRLVERG